MAVVIYRNADGKVERSSERPQSSGMKAVPTETASVSLELPAVLIEAAARRSRDMGITLSELVEVLLRADVPGRIIQPQRSPVRRVA